MSVVRKTSVGGDPTREAPTPNGGPSKTSVWVAAARALGSYDPDPAVRNPDWLAAQFLGPTERSWLSNEPTIRALDQDYRESLNDRHVASIVRYHMQRTKFIDACLQEAAAAGLEQVVTVGAGFDSRAYRFRELLRGVNVFEIDKSATQECKKRCVARVFGTPPSNVTYVPLVLGIDSFFETLRDAGYRSGCTTLFIVEGISMYLSESVIHEVLRVVGTTAGRGSAAAMDIWTIEQLDKSPALSLIFREGAAKVRRWGEPWIFGVPDRCEREFFARFGLDLIETMPMSGEDAIQRYFTRRDGSTVGNIPRPLPAAILGHPGQWLALAKVQ